MSLPHSDASLHQSKGDKSVVDGVAADAIQMSSKSGTSKLIEIHAEVHFHFLTPHI
jgi:hypothetical protein